MKRSVAAFVALVLSALVIGTHGFHAKTFVATLPIKSSTRSGFNSAFVTSTFMKDSTSTALNENEGSMQKDSTSSSFAPKYNHDNPRFFNTALFRTVAVLSSLCLAGYWVSTTSSPLTVPKSIYIVNMVHLLSFGAWFGAIVYTMFIGGVTMVKNLPRPMFGKVQSKLFPKFFKLCAISIILQVSLKSDTNVHN